MHGAATIHDGPGIFRTFAIRFSMTANSARKA
jgi:hypothetical protein